jgi:hypothetical protein
LIKFEHKSFCTEVIKGGHIKAGGALIQFRPWRPLEHDFGASMSYWVRLYLEGIPAYGHTPYVAEQIIVRRCSFDCLDDHSAVMTSARSLNYRAWTTNASAIPKVVWLTFTSRGAGGSASEVVVHEVHPTGSKRGATFHLDQIEDFSMTPLELFGSSTDAEAFKPPPVSFDSSYLMVDGMPPMHLQNEEDDEALSRFAALSRRDRRSGRDDHPRPLPRRRDDHNDDFDRNDGVPQERQDRGERSDRDGVICWERTCSPRHQDGASASYGHRRDVDMPDVPLAVTPPVLTTLRQQHVFVAPHITDFGEALAS